MALKTIRIKVKSVQESLDGALTAMKAVAKGKKPRLQKGEYFESLEAVRSVLTESRLSLLRVIREQQPKSVAELARLVKRDFKRVHEDVEILQSLDLVHAATSKQGKPTRLTSDTTEIVFKIAV